MGRDTIAAVMAVFDAAWARGATDIEVHRADKEWVIVVKLPLRKDVERVSP